MHVFENPYVIIAVFALCFAALIAVGISFAVRGLRAAKGHVESDFITISKMESDFKKFAKERTDRCVTYINVSSENPRTSVSQPNLFADIKLILLSAFSSEGSAVSIYDDENFVALSNWDEETAKSNIENAQSELNKCLLEHSALNLVNVRVGICLAVGTEVGFDEAIDRAKQACRLAKNENRSYAVWDLGSGKALEKKTKIENNIEKEIDNNRFFLEYQPVLDAKTGKIIGAEVLSRLNSESEGVLTPKNFLSAVDSVGINGKFDYYIFEKNCKWISNDKPQREGYKYTINFSRSTLSEPAFAEKIIGIAEKYDLKFSCLAVEILEDKNLTGDAKKQMIDNLSRLKEKGVSILLDDFGSGYTTFGDLQNLDISIVKIDKSITQNSVTETGFIILKNIIKTSQDIGFKTLCEGIETKEQEEAAIKAGCDLLQGYYYYKPMPVAMLENLFDNHSGGI